MRVVAVAPQVIDAVDAQLASRTARMGWPHARDTHFERANGEPFTRGTLDYVGLRVPASRCRAPAGIAHTLAAS